MKAIEFYEVQSSDGSVEWGGASAIDAIEWFRRSQNNEIFVSVWDEEDIEEPRLITDKINITDIVMSAIINQQTRGERA